MLTKIFAGLAVFMAIWSISDSYSQKSAFVLRQEEQRDFSPRYGTRSSGGYRGSTWIYYQGGPRSQYEGFRGGGPGSGK